MERGKKNAQNRERFYTWSTEVIVFPNILNASWLQVHI